MPHGLVVATVTCMVAVASSSMRPAIGGIVPVTASGLAPRFSLPSASLTIFCVQVFDCGP